MKKWDGKSYIHQEKEKKFTEKQKEEFHKKREQAVSERKQIYKPMNIEEIN